MTLQIGDKVVYEKTGRIGTVSAVYDTVCNIRIDKSVFGGFETAYCTIIKKGDFEVGDKVIWENDGEFLIGIITKFVNETCYLKYDNGVGEVERSGFLLKHCTLFEKSKCSNPWQSAHRQKEINNIYDILSKLNSKLLDLQGRIQTHLSRLRELQQEEADEIQMHLANMRALPLDKGQELLQQANLLKKIFHV